mmetsp:Transcript_52556/g.67374  ORF Transcript_52556/g.67374 Transcript_52556/m.67374 type:complete len:234 (-) Transcript_52556:154-855(-)
MKKMQFLLYGLLGIVSFAIAQNWNENSVKANQSYVDYLVADTAEAMNIDGFEFWEHVKASGLKKSVDPFSILLQLREQLQLETNLEFLSDEDNEAPQHIKETSQNNDDFTQLNEFGDTQLSSSSSDPKSDKLPDLRRKLFNWVRLMLDKIDLSFLRVVIDKLIPAPIQIMIAQTFRTTFRVLCAAVSIVRKQLLPLIKSQIAEGSPTRNFLDRLSRAIRKGIMLAKERMNSRG